MILIRVPGQTEYSEEKNNRYSFLSVGQYSYQICIGFT